MEIGYQFMFNDNWQSIITNSIHNNFIFYLQYYAIYIPNTYNAITLLHGI